MGKRAVGYASWHRNRSGRHLGSALDALVQDARARGVDHTVVTGDLVNVGLPGEYLAAALWLERLGPADAVTVIPGNHDAYVAGAMGGWRAWAPWMGGAGPSGEPTLPFLKHVGPLALIGLSTAVPTPLGYARGLLGEPQLAAFEEILRTLRADEVVRVVLLHHPPVDGWSPRRKALADAARFREILGRHGAEMVLCGHEHRLALGALDGPAGGIPVLAAPSASLATAHGSRGGGYLLYGVLPGANGGRITIEHRQLDAMSGRMTTRLVTSVGPVDETRRRRARRAA